MAEPQENPDLKAAMNEIKFISSNNKSDRIMNVQNQLERLTATRFQNPYDVLLLSAEAPDEEIRKQYRQLSILIHPDKCKDDRAYDAFHIVEQAYKTLMNLDKRQVYQRIMREAWDRTVYERKRENKKRVKQGLSELPDDTFNTQYEELCKTLFSEIEEKQDHYQRLQESEKLRKREEIEFRKAKEQYKQVTEEEWEESREKRVGNWRDFSKKKSLVGTKKSNNQIRPPQVKMESRPASAPKLDVLSGKPIGLNEDYKKSWK